MGFLDTILKAQASPGIGASADQRRYQPASVARQLEALDVAWSGGAGMVSRSTAMSIPAFAACRNLICGTVAQLSIQRSRGGEIVPPGYLLTQPDPDSALGAVIEWTVDDILLHGEAAWLVIARDGVSTRELPNGYPVRARRLPPGSWSPVWGDNLGQYRRLEGYEVSGTIVDVQDIIRFEAGHEGILRYGARALRSIFDLELASDRMVAADLPAGILTNEGAELGPDEAQELVESFVAARKTNSIAFLQGLSYETPSVRSAVDLQMSEARGIAATMISRMFNVPVPMIGAAPTGNGTSLTYASVLQSWSAFTKQAVGPVLVALEQGFQQPHVSPRGQKVTFGVEAFLRSDPESAAQYATSLLTAGIIDTEEARSFLGIPERGQTRVDKTPGVV